MSVIDCVLSCQIYGAGMTNNLTVPLVQTGPLDCIKCNCSMEWPIFSLSYKICYNKINQ